MKSILFSIARRFPPRLIRWLGRLQFKAPLLGCLIRKVALNITAREGVIINGVGKGLRFDATGGFPGYLMGTTEPEEQALLASVLRPGGVFFDIGANIGFYTTIAARLVGKSGAVIGFEPFADSARQCRRNAELNGYTQVSVVEAAVSSCSGTLSLHLSSASATHRVSADQNGGVSVKAWALDDYVRTTSARLPDVIMIDVEGAEIEVLAGMKEILARCRPVILCEVHWLGERFVEYVQRELAPLGYSATTYDNMALPVALCRYQAILKPDYISRGASVGVTA